MAAGTERRALIVSSSEKGTEFFKKCLDETFTAEEATCCAEARRRMDVKDYDVVVINCPLKDEFGTELAEEAVKRPCMGVMLLVKSDLYESVSYGMEKIGVYCLSKPISAQAFLHGLSFTIATNERLKGLIKKTEGIREKMEEIKLVGRAKLLLITKLSLSENEAHRYIEKQAMDRCEKRKVIALEIIKTYNA